MSKIKTRQRIPYLCSSRRESCKKAAALDRICYDRRSRNGTSSIYRGLILEKEPAKNEAFGMHTKDRQAKNIPVKDILAKDLQVKNMQVKDTTMSHETSIYQKLTAYAQSDYYPFHMPGHKRTGLPGFPSGQSPASLDITEINGFDDLHKPEGILKEAQDRMAALFGADQSFFLVNGSTAGILASVCACTKRGGRILMARNCHKSVYHAAILQELTVSYLNPPVTEWGIGASIDPARVKTMLDGAPAPFDAMILTSPSYDGVVSDIRSIAKIVHSRGIPLIVDEAHGAHFGFSEAFPQKALALGADLVIESLHKSLPALTQSAALHLRSDRIDPDRLRRYLSIFQTSSPSYLLMAGLDACTRLLEEQGPALFAAYEKRLAAFYQKAANLSHIQVFSDRAGYDPALIYARDPSKILICADPIGMTGSGLLACLRDRFQLELEMASLHYATALTSIMDTDQGFLRLARALEILDGEPQKEGMGSCGEAAMQKAVMHTATGDGAAGNAGPAPALPAKCMEMHQALDGTLDQVSLARAAGRISGGFVTPYPPGIPLLVPGERIDQPQVRLLGRFLAQGIPVHGISQADGRPLLPVLF